MILTFLRYIEISAGKRKRGRDRSMEWGENHSQRSNKNHPGPRGHFHGIRVQHSHSSQNSSEYSMDCQYSDESNMQVIQFCS